MDAEAVRDLAALALRPATPAAKARRPFALDFISVSAKPTTALTPKAAATRRPAQAKPLKPAARKATVAKAAPPSPSRKLAIEPAVKIPSLSPKGKVLGHPRLDHDPLGKVPTRIPGGLSSYLKILSLEKLPDQPTPFGTMTDMFAALFTRFVDEQP